MKTFLAKKIQACPPRRIGSFVWLRRIFDFKTEEHKKTKDCLVVSLRCSPRND